MAKNKLQHILPRTFLKSWSHNNNSLWVYNKDKKIYFELNINNKIFGENYTYNLTLKELSLMNNAELDYILNVFNRYKFEDENKGLLDVIEVITNIDLIDSLSVYEGTRKISNQEKLRLKNISFDRIDLLFQKIENKWPETLKKFSSICDISNRQICVTNKDYEDLVFFAKSLYSRNPEIIYKHITFTKKNHPDLPITEEMFRKIFLSIQIDLFKNDDKKSLLQLSNCYPCFIVASQNNKFICPYNCAQYNFINFEVKNKDRIIELESIAWIPLSPDLLLLFVRNGRDIQEENVLYYDDVNVEQINRDLIVLSDKYFISKNEIYTDCYSKSKQKDD